MMAYARRQRIYIAVQALVSFSVPWHCGSLDLVLTSASEGSEEILDESGQAGLNFEMVGRKSKAISAFRLSFCFCLCHAS